MIFEPNNLGYFGLGVHCSLQIFCFSASGFQLLSKMLTGFQIWYPIFGISKEEGIGAFGVGYFLDQFFGFCAKKLGFFVLVLIACDNKIS